jgi:hypothetical protein
MMNMLMDGGPLFPKWRDRNGNPWPRLAENGLLDIDTQEALKYYQMLWGFWPSGDLCLMTRTLLNPFLRFRGALQLRYPTWRPGLSGAPVAGNSPAVNKAPSPSPALKNPRPGPPPPPAPAPISKKSSGDDDKPWIPQLKLNYGFGLTQPLWVGKTRSGMGAPGSASKTEADEKLEFDVEVPTSVAIGQGHLTLSLGAEYDSPLDNTHKGKPTVAGNFELSADDLVKFGGKRFALSPFAGISVQDQKGVVSVVGKVGAELKLNITKHMALKVDASVFEIQGGVHGLDPKQDPKVVIPFEGNAKFEVQFP